MSFLDNVLRRDIPATDPAGRETAVRGGQRFFMRDYSRDNDWVEFTVEHPPGVIFKSSLAVLLDAATDRERQQRAAKAEFERLRARAHQQLEWMIEFRLADGYSLLKRTEDGARLFKREPKFVNFGSDLRIRLPGVSEPVICTLDVDERAGEVLVRMTKV